MKELIPGNLYRVKNNGNLFLATGPFSILWIVSEQRNSFMPDAMGITKDSLYMYEDLGCLGKLLNLAINGEHNEV